MDQDRIDSSMLASNGFYPRKDPLDPSVRKLARAILHRALRDMLTNEPTFSGSSDAREQDAAEWFLSDTTDPGSLNWVCDILTIQPWGLCKWLSRYHKSIRQQKESMARELFRSLRPKAVPK